MNWTLMKKNRRCIGLIVVLATAASTLAGCAPNDPVWQKNQRDLANLEACGYTPKAWDPWYPEDIQLAQRRYDRGECGAR
ncbi:MAG TPA: hypothetical protein VL424_16445 [Pararobbsia sp.]|jgi:hypothetical protein|nr:hypothetical protein [Pararobbsia sp.]